MAINGEGQLELSPELYNMEKRNSSECQLSETLAAALADILENWNDSRARQELEETRKKFQDRATQIADDAVETERLDASDFAFRINATR